MPIEELKLKRNPITEKLQDEIEYLHMQNGVLADALIIAASSMPVDGLTTADIIKQWIDKAFLALLERQTKESQNGNK